MSGLGRGRVKTRRAPCHRVLRCTFEARALDSDELGNVESRRIERTQIARGVFTQPRSETAGRASVISARNGHSKKVPDAFKVAVQNHSLVSFDDPFRNGGTGQGS
jgi:hypothetical protein